MVQGLACKTTTTLSTLCYLGWYSSCCRTNPINFVQDWLLAGTESAVHDIRLVLNHDDSDVILLVDTTNAFSSSNRSVALYNIQQLCPPLACVLSNTCCSPASLSVSGNTILSEAMLIYTIVMILLIHHLTDSVTQVWYADDAYACGRLSSLCQWWDQFCKLGPGFGFFGWL